MTTTDKIARRKLTLLQLASDLDNVSRACKLAGYSRQQFYEIRRNFQTYGADGLIDRMPAAMTAPEMSVATAQPPSTPTRRKRMREPMPSWRVIAS